MKPEEMNEIINKYTDVPVLFKFYNPWCGPCKILTPIVEYISNIFGNKIKVFNIDADLWPDVADKHNVMGTPTLILYKNGTEKERFTGLLTKEFLINMITRNLA